MSSGYSISSICDVYVELIENELDSDDPDMALVRENLDRIRRYCGAKPYPKGETPEHLKEYLYESSE